MKTNQKNEIMVQYSIGDTEIKLTPTIVKNYLTNGADVTMSEFKMFTELCKSRKLNPFLKEAYVIKFGNQPAQIVVGKDAILKRAILNPKFNGREQGIIIINNKGEFEERKGTFKLRTEELVGAWAKVYRKDWEYPLCVTVSFDEVAQRRRDGQLNSNWATKGATMVEKVALVRALREAFVEDVGGMIDEDEVWRDENIQSARSSTPQANEQNDPIEVEEVEEVEIEEVEF
jgi:phage recombination protein Bet